jgi:hypothetical protein
VRVFRIAVVAGMLPIASAEAESFAGHIADGLQWSANAQDRGNMRMTLHPDGTGRMEIGILSRRVGWHEEDDAICLTGLPGVAMRCITFRPVDGGFEGIGPDGQRFVLQR